MPRGADRRRPTESPSGAPPGDLCTTCRNANLCVYCTPDREPVVSCTGFLAGGGPQSPKRGPVALPSKPDELAGLCVNCARREECTLEKPASGVWHCVEYC